MDISLSERARLAHPWPVRAPTSKPPHFITWRTFPAGLCCLDLSWHSRPFLIFFFRFVYSEHDIHTYYQGTSYYRARTWYRYVVSSATVLPIPLLIVLLLYCTRTFLLALLWLRSLVDYGRRGVGVGFEKLHLRFLCTRYAVCGTSIVVFP